MIKRVYRSIGEKNLFITVTTRKANNISVWFGKFTFWQSKEHYDRGDCEGAYTYEGIFLGEYKSRLGKEANKFIDETLKRGEMIWPR